MKTLTNYSGRKFGRLTAETIVRDDSGKIKWLCSCECGNKKAVRPLDLVLGKTTSCGCYHREMVGERVRTHGLSNTSEHGIWRAIKKRCYNPKHKQYKDYGGRGITVCDEWRDSFEAFYRDMGPRPTSRHCIDRRDNNKGYSKENCRWSTYLEQANNRSDNLSYEFEGEWKTLAEWCRELNISYQKMYKNLNKGMSFEDAANCVIKDNDSE